MCLVPFMGKRALKVVAYSSQFPWIISKGFFFFEEKIIMLFR